ncbi:MAG: N-acetyltransferase family protein [Bacteroidota bacterium]
MATALHFRLAVDSDIPAITRILNQSIQTGGQNAFTETVTEADRANWLSHHPADRWPVFMIESAAKVVGWCSFSPYRPERKSLSGLIEISYYLDKAAQGQGIGSATIDFMLEEAQRLDYRHLFAVTMDTNIPSIRLLEKKGFAHWAHLPEVAVLNGKVCGQVYLGRAVSKTETEIF